ncbi:hypothetical protein KJ365_13640 [Glaciecola sp. XM2]|uniref:5-oxoprolinase subunit C family protein n=1 Tax=Glaciecola sp. XM2 TaxID=1914931 RepID=UPI001BDE610B|nr:hypothetical protein [Glaciecola sp. XM2]MBT1451930.1 hypothetical protein [Glaciecola sp. XM2]
MIECQHIGFYAQLVDDGRKHASHHGYSESGALDWKSFDVANALVGNTSKPRSKGRNHVAIEITLGEAQLKFHEPCMIAITGANALCKVNHKPCSMYQALLLKKGDVLSISNIGHGTQGYGQHVYIAVRNGLETPQLFSSASNVMREGRGGLHQNGQGLLTGDILPTCANIPQAVSSAHIEDVHKATADFLKSIKRVDDVAQAMPLKIIPGYQFNHFSASQKALLLSSIYKVSAEANRMAVKLEGRPIKCGITTLSSQGLCNGAIQCTGAGQLIVMLNDRQSIGGYPVLGSLSACSRAQLAQMTPGSAVQFTFVDVLRSVADVRMWKASIEKISTTVDQMLSS